MIDPMQNSASPGRSVPMDPSAVRRSMDIADPRARAEQVATQLESVFMGLVMKAMRDTVPEDGVFGKGLGGKNYIEMLDQQYAQLEGIPRDPRFHEALVRQILQDPGKTGQALGKMGNAEREMRSEELSNPGFQLSNPE